MFIVMVNKGFQKKTSRLKEVNHQRYQAESNRCTRFCRPLPSHSAMIPIMMQK